MRSHAALPIASLFRGEQTRLTKKHYAKAPSSVATAESELQNIAASSVRRHDLDALRGFAMLLGIVLHGAMSFVPGFERVWGVQDSQANGSFGVMLAAIHGWRMPLFFLVSGFFTAMLWKKRGLRALLLHRFKRIFLPLLLAMVTIIPLMWFVSGYVRSQASAGADAAVQADVEDEGDTPEAAPDKVTVDIWEAVTLGDKIAIERYLDRGGDVNAKNPSSGATPLHVACFFGKIEAAELLLDADASLEATNNEGLTPQQLLNIDWATTEYIGNILQLKLEKENVLSGRSQIAARIAEITGENIDATPQDSEAAILNGLIGLLFYFPVFNHLWFLWFLCWFVMGFAMIAKIAEVLRIPSVPNSLIRSWCRYLWLIPLAGLPQYLMARTPGAFGPDTSIGLFPLPAVFVYYAIFFGFGVLYFGSQDREVTIGRHCGWSIAFALIVLFPIGLAMKQPELGGERLLFSLVQVSYAWFMSFGLIGLFHRLFSGDRRWVRYLSDSSYWLYLVHIPLVIYLQLLVRDWAMPSLLKFSFVCVLATAVLLLSYQLCVRNTWIGVLLNGRRYPGKPQESPTIDASQAVSLAKETGN
ncbi:MAG: acyltransferase family protein [Planctomycetota bacterium]